MAGKSEGRKEYAYESQTSWNLYTAPRKEAKNN
jgi:hypothetical protein